MKKQILRRSAALQHHKPIIIIGQVIHELSVWDFGEDAYITCHNINQIAKALEMNYNLQNFGTESFGLEPSPEDEG
jgi:hypothetical protein